MFMLIRNELLLRPVYNMFLIFLELFQGNIGWAIIFLTIFVRLALYRNSANASSMQSQMSDLQPKIQEIQEKYKDDPEQLSKKTMELLKKDGVGPMKGCMSMLLQIPVFYGLYAVISNIANPDGVASMMKFPLSLLEMTYSFLYPYVYNMIQAINLHTDFFGINVLEKNSLILTVIGGLLMFINISIMSWTRPATPSLP